MAAYTRKQYSGAARNTTTTTLLTNVGTTVDIAATTGWPSVAGVPFYIVIEPASINEEKCLATISGSTLTLTRAQDDTTASEHPIGSVIYPVFTANDADEANEVVSKLTTKGDLLVTTGNSLERLPVGSNGTFLKANSSASVGAEWSGITLGTDTSGNYVSGFTQGTGVTITHTPGEGSNATIGIGQAVGTSASVTFANVTADLVGNVTGNADTATALGTARTIELSGDVSGSASFDGTANINLVTTVNTASVAIGELYGVNITSPEEFQTLAYNGTEWVNQYASVVSYVRNAEATTITTGTPVYLFGGNGDHASVKRADNSSDATSSKTVGLAGADITASQNGPVITRGYVDGVDLSMYAAGDVLWLGKNGQVTTTKPSAPDHLVFIGVVVRATINGIVYVATQNGYELEELHDVKISDLSDGQFLRYNSASTVWVNDTINLGTDTAGSYVASLVAGAGITLTNNSGEGATPTVAIGQAVGTSDSPTFAGLNVNGNIVFEGTTANEFETTLSVTDPTADRTITLPNVTGTVITTGDTGSVTSTMIADGTIVNGDINASAAIDKTKISGTAITAADSGTVTSTMIADGTIVNADINASAGIALSKLATSTAGNIIVYNASGIPTAVAETGDVTISDTGVTAIASGVIVDADINASAAIVDTKLATISTADKVSLSAINIDGGTDIGAALADADLVIVDDGGAGTNRKAAVTRISDYVFGKVSGDVTIASNGAATIAANSVALGTDTTGNYVQSLVQGTGVTLSNATASEGGTPTIAIGQDVATSASPTFARITISGTPSSTTDAVTKSYVDNVAAGVNWHEAVSYATTAVLPNTPTYNNGADGVGATLTAGSNARLMVDGLNVSNGNRILVKNQSTQTQNGIYDVTEQGSVSTPWILTRAADFNQNTVAGSIDTGEAVYVRLGNFNAGTGHVLTSTGTGDGDRHIPGTDNFVFTQFSGLTTTVAGAGLTTNGTSISVGTASSGRIVVNADDIDLATVAQSNSTAADTLSFAKTVNVDSYGRVTGVVSASVDLSSKANLAGPTFTGTVVLPSTTSIGDVSSTEIGYLNNVTSAIQTQIDTKAPLDSPIFTGTVTLPNNTVALGTKTTGDYVQSLVAGTGVSLANNSGESATPTVSIGQSVATTASVSFANVTANVTGNVTGDVTGNVTGSSGSTTGNAATATTLQNARTISISGDVSGSVSFNGSTNVDISATIQPNSVALGTDTTGNYMSGVSSGTGISVTHTPGEGSTATVALNATLDDLSNVTAPSPSDGQFLKYVSASTAWVPAAIPTINNLDDVGDVSAPSPTSGDFLKWNGTAWVNDPINLGTDTVGNYMSDLTQGTGVTITHTPGEGSNATIAIGQAIGTSDSPTFAGVNVNGSIVFEGTTANEFETTLSVTDPTADRTITLPNVTGTVITTGDSGTVTSTMIADGTIVNGDINASAGIALSKLATSTAGNIIVYNASGVPTAVAETGDVTISDSGVTAIASGVIVNADINASAGIELSKLASSTAGNIIVYNASGVPTAVAETGDVTISDTGVTAIASGVIVNADINASAAIDKTKISGTAITAADTGTVTSAMISDGTIVNGDISAAAAIALSKLASGTSGQIIVANSSGVPTWVSESGDVTISDTGVTAISSGVIVDADVSSSAAIAHSKLASGTAGQVLLGTTTTGVITATTISGDITINGAGVASIAANSVALGTDTTGDYVASLVAGTGVTLTNNSGEGATPTVAIGQSVATSASPSFGSLSTTGALYVGTDLHVGGTYYTTTETNLAIQDSFIYLNDGNTISNPDLGWAGNYNDGTYAHAGIFRDASDGKFKFFDSYTPEPTDPINTAHASYSAAPVVAEVFESTIATGTSPLSVSSSTVVTNLNADLLDGQHGSYYAPLASPTFTGTVTLPTGTVTSGMILDGTIANADINASAAIAHSKLANATAGQVLLGTTTTGVVTATTVSGDVTITGGGVTAIGAGVIVNADVNASAAIALSKLATGTAGTVVLHNASGVPTATAVSGDVTISDTGVTAIASGVIVNADINASAAIDKTKISGTAITAADSGTVTSTMIADGTIVNADINASAAIAHSKLANATAGQVLLGTTTTGVVTATTISGDVTITGGGVTAIASGAVVDADINASAAITHSKLANITAGSVLMGNATNVPTATALTGDVTVTSSGVTAIGSGVIVNADVNASAAIDYSKLAALTSGNILVGNASNVATSVAVTGDVTITNAGVTAIGSGVIVNADINASAAIDKTKISGTAVTVADTGTVTSAMIADATIVNGDISTTAAIAHSKLANATAGQVLLGTTTTGVVTATTISGDVTITGAGVTAIGSGVIVNDDINASAGIALSKLATSTAGNIIVYNSSGVPTAVAETGDVTISDTGVTAIASGVIVNADISATAAIDLGKLADVSTNAQTASYSLVLADKNKVVEMNVGSANNLTVPLNSSQAFPVGSQINILQTGAGQTTIVATGGVTINATPGLKMRAQWSYATLIKRATDTWVLVGDISA